MKKLLAILLFIPAFSWAAFQPVTGSSVTVYAPNNNTTNLPVTANIASTALAITTVSFNGSSQPTNLTGTAFAVTTTTFNGSSQPMNLTGTAFAITTTTFNGSAQPVNINATSMAITTVTFNGAQQPVSVQNSTVTVQGIFSDNGAASATNRETTLPGIYQRGYGNSTSGTIGNNAALEVLTDHGLHVANLPAMQPTSYSASTNTFSMSASTEDFTALCGSASSTTLVTGLRISCTETTAGIVPITVAKRSTGYTAIWSTMSTVAEDSNYAISASSAIFFTTNPHATDGTLVGYLDSYQLGCMAAGTASPNDVYISPANWRMKPIVLRGAGQCIGVNTQSTTVTGNKWAVQWNWIEIPTISP